VLEKTIKFAEEFFGCPSISDQKAPAEFKATRKKRGV
jgi:hypothetical protein